MWKKYCCAGQATGDNMVYVHCMLDTWGYKHALKICNTYCFSTATVVAQMCLTLMLYIHCQSSYLSVSDTLFWQERQCHNNSGKYPEKLLSNVFIPFPSVTAVKIAAEFLNWQSGPLPCKISRCWKVPIYTCKGTWSLVLNLCTWHN